MFQLPFPQIAFDIIDFVGKVAVPLTLVVLGASLASIKIKSLSTTLLASLIRMGAGLGLGILVVKLFSLTDVTAAVVVLVSAMPSAVLSSVLAVKYKNEASLVSSVVLLTTLMSIVTIPLILKYFSNL